MKHFQLGTLLCYNKQRVLIILFLAVDAMRHCDLETNRASQLMWSIFFVVHVPTVAAQLTNNHIDAQFVKTKP
jgi:hypothetical protein